MRMIQIPTMSQSDIDRFWDKVKRRGTNDCWEWKTGTSTSKYPVFMLHRTAYSAHRVVLFLTIGEIPDGVCACHKCDNPRCCNPRHVFAGTYQDNMQDKVSKLHSSGILNGRAKLNAGLVREIRNRYETNQANQYELADEYGVHQSHIQRIVNYKLWVHI